MTLTTREQQIIAALAAGKTLREIATDSGVGYQYIKNSVKQLRDRLGYRTTEQMLCAEYHRSLDANTEQAVHSPRT